MRHRFGSRLDPREVVVPVLLEPSRPVVNHLEPGAVHPIRPTPTDGPNYDEFDPSKHTQVLRNNSLRPTRLAHQLRDIQLRIPEAVKQVPPSRFSDGIEHVSGCGCTGHKVIVLPYRNTSSRQIQSHRRTKLPASAMASNAKVKNLYLFGQNKR